MNNYLPEGYEVPKTGGNYMKFKQGANKFRILSAPVMGWEYWTEDSKPVRAKERWNTIPVNARLPWNPKHFWALIVWSFDDKAIQVLQITQSTILSALQDLIQNEEWGDPRQYSITITKKGEKLDTEYSVMPSQMKETPKEILDLYKEKNPNLEALFTGGDPFGTEKSEITAEDMGEDAVPFD